MKTDVPKNYQQGLNNLLDMGANAAGADFQYYNDPRIAGFDPAQQQALDSLSNNLGLYDPLISAATQASQTMISGGGLPIESEVQALMDPYKRNVLEGAQGRLFDQYQSLLGDIGSRSALSGAFGGTRQGVLEGAAGSEFLKSGSELYYGGMSDAWNQAINNWFRGQDNQRANVTTGMNTAIGAMNSKINNANALAAAGASRRNVDQANLDFAYQQFAENNNWDWQQASNYGNLLYNYPRDIFTKHQNTTQTSTPSMGSVVMGLGAMAAGAMTGNPAALTGGASALKGPEMPQVAPNFNTQYIPMAGNILVPDYKTSDVGQKSYGSGGGYKAGGKVRTRGKDYINPRGQVEFVNRNGYVVGGPNTHPYGSSKNYLDKIYADWLWSSRSDPDAQFYRDLRDKIDVTPEDALSAWQDEAWKIYPSKLDPPKKFAFGGIVPGMGGPQNLPNFGGLERIPGIFQQAMQRPQVQNFLQSLQNNPKMQQLMQRFVPQGQQFQMPNNLPQAFNQPQWKAQQAVNQQPGQQGMSNLIAPRAFAKGGKVKKFDRGGRVTAAEKELMDGLITRGFTRDQAAVVVGNMFAESSHKPDAVNSKSGAIGLMQWLGPRKKELEAMAAARNLPWTDRGLQLDFATRELLNGGPESANFDRAMSRGQGLRDQAYLFGKYVERPSASELSGSVNRRADMAERAFGNYVPQTREAANANREQARRRVGNNALEGSILDYANNLPSRGVREELLKPAPRKGNKTPTFAEDPLGGIARGYGDYFSGVMDNLVVPAYQGLEYSAKGLSQAGQDFVKYFNPEFTAEVRDAEGKVLAPILAKGRKGLSDADKKIRQNQENLNALAVRAAEDKLRRNTDTNADRIARGQAIRDRNTVRPRGNDVFGPLSYTGYNKGKEPPPGFNLNDLILPSSVREKAEPPPYTFSPLENHLGMIFPDLPKEAPVQPRHKPVPSRAKPSLTEDEDLEATRAAQALWDARRNDHAFAKGGFVKGYAGGRGVSYDPNDEFLDAADLPDMSVDPRAQERFVQNFIAPLLQEGNKTRGEDWMNTFANWGTLPLRMGTALGAGIVDTARGMGGLGEYFGSEAPYTGRLPGVTPSSVQPKFRDRNPLELDPAQETANSGRGITSSPLDDLMNEVMMSRFQEMKARDQERKVPLFGLFENANEPLMRFGLSMLANSNKNFGEALGTAGLQEMAAEEQDRLGAVSRRNDEMKDLANMGFMRAQAQAMDPQKKIELINHSFALDMIRRAQENEWKKELAQWAAQNKIDLARLPFEMMNQQVGSDENPTD